MRKGANFQSALAASLILHLFLLWPARSPERQGEAGQPLSVVLQPGTSAALSAPPAPRPARAVASMHRAPLPVAAEEVPRTLQNPVSAPQSNTLASTAEIPRRSEKAAPTGVGSDHESPRPVAAAARPGLDADGVRQYRMALAVEARRYRRYPRSALAEEQGGTVEVRIAVAAGGQTQEVAVARSSGVGALDDAAVEMLRQAAPRTAVPDLLRHQAFVINLPVVFDVASE